MSVWRSGVSRVGSAVRSMAFFSYSVGERAMSSASPAVRNNRAAIRLAKLSPA